MLKSQIFNVANISFNAILKNKIPQKISEFTVFKFTNIQTNKFTSTKSIKDDSKNYCTLC